MQEMALTQITKISFHRWLVPAGIIILILLAIFIPRQVDKQNIWNLFFLICLHISLGQSWNILAGFAGQTSLGHAAFFGIGALVTRTLWFQGTPFALAFISGGVAAVIFAMLIGAPTFRLRGAYFAIGTLGVAEVLRITASQNLPLISTMSGPTIATYNLQARYYLALGLALATTGAAYTLLRSPRSLGILAVREDEEAAQATGVHVLRHTFCSHLAMRGAPARAIQELAGHADLRTTQRYMHLSPAALDAAIRLLDAPTAVSRGNIVATERSAICKLFRIKSLWR